MIFLMRRKLREPRVRIITIFLFVIIFYLLDYIFGIIEHLQETSFCYFKWPLEVDIPELVRKIQNNEREEVEKINPFPYRILKENKELCKDVSLSNSIFVLIIIKSATWSFTSRQAIRESWGNEKILNFSKAGIQRHLVTKRVFLIGNSLVDNSVHSLEEEYEKYKDILQGDFQDGYFNNTYKTMMGFTFAATHCPNAHFAFFVDEDFYVSKRNTAQYLFSLSETDALGLFTGFSPRDTPQLQRGRMSKFYIPLQEYEYRYLPRYVYAGAYIISMNNLRDMAIAMPYVKFFRLDDVYLGFVTFKLGIKVTENNGRFLCEVTSPREDDIINGHVIASHGFKDNAKLMQRFWRIAAEE